MSQRCLELLHVTQDHWVDFHEMSEDREGEWSAEGPLKLSIDTESILIITEIIAK